MSSYFAQVVKHAKFTCDPQNNATFLKNFSILKTLVDKLTATDIQIDEALWLEKIVPKQPRSSEFMMMRPLPCTYVKIYESPNISISVFVLTESFTMPIHDHPQIYGILKTIQGKMRIQSYTASNDGGAVVSSLQQAKLNVLSNYITDKPTTNKKLEENNKDEQQQQHYPDTTTTNTLPMFIPVIKEPSKELTIDTESIILTPTESNFHEITAIDGPVAFFDILTPPYEKDIPIYGPRKCSYYRNIENKDDETVDAATAAGTSIDDGTTTTSPSKPSIRRSILQRIPCPPTYFCDNGYYKQPAFLLDD